jgi:hypothetical protein
MHDQTKPVKYQGTNIPAIIRATNGRVQKIEIRDAGVYDQSDDCNQANDQNEFNKVWFHFSGSQKKETCPPES